MGWMFYTTQRVLTSQHTTKFLSTFLSSLLLQALEAVTSSSINCWGGTQSLRHRFAHVSKEITAFQIQEGTAAFLHTTSDPRTCYSSLI